LPIDSDEFAKGRKIAGIERTILQFLKGNKTKAFTQPEILSSLYAYDTSSWGAIVKGVLIALGVERALEGLVRDGSVRAKQIENQTYYKAV
jgi:hypothetical protein